MYAELYATWQLEIENSGLGSLPLDFFVRVAEYLRRITEEYKMMDQKSVRTTLLERERSNAVYMAKELVETRYRKLMKMMVAGQKTPSDSLAAEEIKLYNGVLASAGVFNKFIKNLIEGRPGTANIEASIRAAEAPMAHKRVTLRFLKPVPSIIGYDMKSYGPFLVEDVASVPTENAKILLKQGLAKIVELE